MSWKRLARKSIYKTSFIEVHEDTVEVKPGVVIDDYSVVSFKGGVAVVATDTAGKLIVIDEYKYGGDRVATIVPCGTLEPNEDIVESALRELREETGYSAKSGELIGSFYEYSSKLTHTSHVVRVKNAYRVCEPSHEDTESIGDIRLLSKQQALRPGAFVDAGVVTAIFWTLAQED